VEKGKQKLQEDILEIYNESGKIYGAPKIHKELKAKGYEKISLKRVQRHMKKLGIRSDVLYINNFDIILNPFFLSLGIKKWRSLFSSWLPLTLLF